MIRYLQHIAFFLLLALTVPLAYQPMHILLHHSSIEEADLHLHCSHHKETDADFPTKINNQTEKCIICEYTFAGNYLPSLNRYEILQEIILPEKYVANPDVYIKFLASNSTPRAPPV